MPTSQSTVAVVGLGGTIAMTATPDGGVAPALSAEQLVAAVPGLADTGITIEVADFRRVPGASLTFADLTALADTIRRLCAKGVDGVVVTQGTDTIEETAYFLDLRLDLPQPVVVTGAMRNPTLAGADGPANLLAAVRTAASPTTRNLGCVVVFADEIHAAHRVRKTHTTTCATFASPDGGPLGHLVEGTPRILNHTTRHPMPAGIDTRGDVRVGLVTATLGDDGHHLSTLDGHVDGLVVAAFGAGHVPATWIDPLDKLARRVPVVLASRTGSGPVLTATYGFPGSERDLLDRGLVNAGFLHPLKARILLHALLSADADHDTITAAFADAGHTTPGDRHPQP
ncbi:asparaginase [Saccharothrix violaceirubra]|uniref:L-asparaginase n=1 Tax=Saccharothrix violaceirubra TaxID=413306 RepID=A0A7W7T4E5_9PSEU|nr:asparaginase [Saccharothrix violaceirubra]MBB4966370.1 L-asparaginase [Saccharothrix violaceirubra]